MRKIMLLACLAATGSLVTAQVEILNFFGETETITLPRKIMFSESEMLVTAADGATESLDDVRKLAFSNYALPIDADAMRGHTADGMRICRRAGGFIIYLPSGQHAGAMLSIFSPDGTLMISLPGQHAAVASGIAWDGMDSEGNPAAPGVYLAHIHSPGKPVASMPFILK